MTVKGKSVSVAQRENLHALEPMVSLIATLATPQSVCRIAMSFGEGWMLNRKRIWAS